MSFARMAIGLFCMLACMSGAMVSIEADELQDALYRGNMAKAKGLITSNPELVNSPDEYGFTPLWHAARSNSKQFVKWLLERGAQTPPIHRATMLGDANAVRSIVRADRKLVNAPDQWRHAPLHYAALLGDTQLTRTLLHAGAAVNIRPPKSGDPDSSVMWGLETPLHFAAMNGHVEVAKVLLSCRADVNAKDYAAETPLHCAAYWGHTEMARLLISKGANVNVIGYGDYGELLTPLHRAAEAGTFDVTKLLIARGAKINAKNDEGSTPLALAIESGNKKLADLIRKHGGRE